MRDIAVMLTALLAFGSAFADPVALVADRVIDGVGDLARTNTVVVVDGERIVAVAGNPLEDMKALERVEFVIPGRSRARDKHGHQ